MTMNSSAVQISNPYLWGTVFATLSLDLARPFVEDMGLQLPPQESFFQGLRKLILQFRAREISDPKSEEDFSASVFVWLEREFNPAFAQHLHWWGENIFQSGENTSKSVAAFFWDNLIRYGGLDGSRDRQKPPEFIIRVRRELAERSRPPVNRLTPSTQWDLEIYRRHGYTAMNNPMELVQGTINYCTFVLAWSEATLALGKNAQDEEVQEWARKEARTIGMPQEYLEMPGTWKLPPDKWKNNSGDE